MLVFEVYLKYIYEILENPFDCVIFNIFINNKFILVKFTLRDKIITYFYKIIY